MLARHAGESRDGRRTTYRPARVRIWSLERPMAAPGGLGRRFQLGVRPVVDARSGGSGRAFGESCVSWLEFLGTTVDFNERRPPVSPLPRPCDAEVRSFTRTLRLLWLVALLELFPVPMAHAQSNLQLWGNVTLDWVKSDRLVYQLDFEPKVNAGSARRRTGLAEPGPHAERGGTRRRAGWISSPKQSLATRSRPTT